MALAQILVVEDERPVAEDIQRMATRSGYAVAGVASSGEQTLRHVAAAPPDLIVIDLELRGNPDGMAIAEQIRSQFDIPLLYLTSDPQKTPVEYLLKPCNEREFRAAVETALYKRDTNRQLRDMERQVHILNQQLQEAGQHKSNFLASMSHELRTPLNAMIGYTSLTLNALKDTLPQEHLQHLIKAEQSARRLLQLINDVLDFSKIEAGKLELFIEEIELSDLLEDVINTAEGLVAHKPVELNIDLPEELLRIESDYTRLKQILDNLIGNAVKFTSEGHVAVRGMLNEAARMLHLEVEDTGCGIPSELLGNIFELFRQVDGSITKKHAGTGLGLAIVTRLCAMLGIRISVQSDVHKGTTFWLDIPFKFGEGEFDATIIEGAASTENSSQEQRPAATSVQPSEKPSPPAHERNQRQTSTNAVVLGFCRTEVCTAIKRHLAGLPLTFQRVTTPVECIEIGKRSLIWAIVLESDASDSDILTYLKQEFSLQHIPIVIVPEHTKPEEIAAMVRSISLTGTHTLLIVDDNNANLDLMRSILEPSGYTIYTAQSGPAGIELAAQTHPDVIVMDIAMPVMDGFEATRRLKQSPETADIPVIACSAFATREYRGRAAQAGCEGYIPKPIEPHRLIEQVQKVIITAKIKKFVR